ncbi:MAG: ferritin-like domain-containing protein [Verrucomicrobiota bacterium]
MNGDTRLVIAQIGKHETAHVAFLKTTINSLGGTPVAKPTFDFTATGVFADVFSNPATFLALAQAFEDTGVRAYKGQAANLLGNKDVLQAALQIHSVEARHASEVRRLRGSKGWITQSNNTSAPAAAAVYAGENNTTHLGVNATTVVTVDSNALTEAYDEILTMTEVLAIAGLFIQ